MPRNGSGVYNLPAGNPVVTGTVISSATQNSTMSDVAAALTQSLASDGQTPLLANLNANGNRITNLGSSASSTDAANRGDITSLIASTPPRGYIAGLTMSTAGSSTTFTVAPGSCADSTNAYLMTLGVSLNKTTGAWSTGTGNGSLDTGAIANSTWYHVYLIRRPDTGVVDVLTSLSASSPTLPANYTQFRRLGSLRTNGSSQWTLFTQVGDTFLWAVPTSDVVTSALTTARSLFTVTTPPGVITEAICYGNMVNASIATVWAGAVSVTDAAPTVSGTPGALIVNPAAGQPATFQLRALTNTSSQIAARSDTASTTLRIQTQGWVDRRGKDD